MTRCRGARGCPCRSAPRWCPRTGPSAAWGGISRRPAAAPTPPGGRRHGLAAPIGCQSGLERATQARRAVVSAPRTARSARGVVSTSPDSPDQRPRRGDQRSMACSRSVSTAVQRPSVPAQGYGDVHERLGAAQQPLSSPPSASISASMCLRWRVSAGRRAAVASSPGPPIRPGTPGRPPPPPRSVPGPRSAGGSLCRARASEISEKELGGGGYLGQKKIRKWGIGGRFASAHTAARVGRPADGDPARRDKGVGTRQTQRRALRPSLLPCPKCNSEADVAPFQKTTSHVA